MDVGVNREEEIDGKVETIFLKSTQPKQFTSVSSSSKGKKHTRESSVSTDKSFSKKVKKTDEKKKVSSTSKQLIEELLTNISNSDRSLEETSESVNNFLQLSERIDHAETKNEKASWSLIFSYFIFRKAVFKRYKELKLEYGKNRFQALVKSEVREAISEAKYSDEALRKRMERSEKIYKIFNSIGKEKIVQIKSTLSDFILNLTKDEKDYVIAEILKWKVWYKCTVSFSSA